MTSASRASLAFAFYAYTPLFQHARASTQPLMNEASITTTTLPQTAGDAQLQSMSTTNCASYAPKRKREESHFGEMIKKRRNGLHMDNDWEMIDAWRKAKAADCATDIRTPSRTKRRPKMSIRYLISYGLITKGRIFTRRLSLVSKMQPNNQKRKIIIGVLYHFVCRSKEEQCAARSWNGRALPLIGASHWLSIGADHIYWKIKRSHNV